MFPNRWVPRLLGGETVCDWTLPLDNGRALEWPWADPRGNASEIYDNFSANAPISVRHWQGTLYHIALNDRVFLDYVDSAGVKLDGQGTEVGLGLIVVALAVVTMTWQSPSCGRWWRTPGRTSLEWAWSGSASAGQGCS